MKPSAALRGRYRSSYGQRNPPEKGEQRVKTACKTSAKLELSKAFHRKLIYRSAVQNEMQEKGQFWSQKTFGCEIMCGSRKRSSYKNVQSPICCSLVQITAQTADKKFSLFTGLESKERRGSTWKHLYASLQRSFSVSDTCQQDASAGLGLSGLYTTWKFLPWFQPGHRSGPRKQITAHVAEGRTSWKSEAGGQTGSNSLPPCKEGHKYRKKCIKTSPLLLLEMHYAATLTGSARSWKMLTTTLGWFSFCIFQICTCRALGQIHSSNFQICF